MRCRGDDRSSNLGNQIGGVLAVRRIEDAHFGTAGWVGPKEVRWMKRLSGLIRLLTLLSHLVTSSGGA